MSLTKIGSIGINTGIQFAGVTTVSTLHVGSGVTLSSDGDIFATGISTFSEDIKVGSGVTISPDGDIFATGISTFTNSMIEMRSDMSSSGQENKNIFRFTDTDASTTDNQSMGRLQWFSSDTSGGGACVKAEIEAVANDTTPEGNLIFKTHTGSGTTPTERLRIQNNGAIGLSGTNYGSSGQVLTSQGSGSAVTWATVTQTTINSNADNRIITGSGTANTLNGESNLTFDGTDLSVTGSANVAGTLILQPGGTAWSTTNTRPQLGRQSDGELRIGAGSDSSSIITFYTSPSAGGTLAERLRIFKNGDVGIGTATVLGDSKVHINDSSLSNYRSLVLESVATNGSTMIYRQNGAQVISIGSGGGNNLSGSNLTHGLIRSEVATIFAVGNSEKIRIASDGTFTNSQSGNAPTSGSGWGFTQDQLYLSTDGTSANYALRFYNDNGLVGSVLVNGSGVTYNTSSDYRLKENQVSISDAISKVKQLKPYTFNFKSDSTTKIDGFFAHEAQEVVPHAVSGEKDGEQMQSMDYGKLTPLLTAALQEAISEIETLKTEVAALKSQLNN